MGATARSTAAALLIADQCETASPSGPVGHQMPPVGKCGNCACGQESPDIARAFPLPPGCCECGHVGVECERLAPRRDAGHVGDGWRLVRVVPCWPCRLALARAGRVRSGLTAGAVALSPGRGRGLVQLAPWRVVVGLGRRWARPAGSSRVNGADRAFRRVWRQPGRRMWARKNPRALRAKGAGGVSG